jgi:hypothetical protein
LLDKPNLAGDLLGIMDYLNEDQKKEFKPVHVSKGGEAIFHHSLTLHGSGGKQTNQQEGHL